MIDYSEVHIYSDQPTIFPLCDTTSDVLLDLSHTKDTTQIHKCMNEGSMKYEFIMQYDEDFDNNTLL